MAKNRQEDELGHLEELLDEHNTAMLVTKRDDGSLCARPMQIVGREDGLELWFLTGKDTEKSAEISHHGEALVSFQSDRKDYISLSGQAKLVQDKQRVDELWRTEWEAWFPRGKDDPNIALIQFVPTEAEYWDNRGLKGVRYVIQVAKALVTGRPPDIKEGMQHGELKNL